MFASSQVHSQKNIQSPFLKKLERSDSDRDHRMNATLVCVITNIARDQVAQLRSMATDQLNPLSTRTATHHFREPKICSNHILAEKRHHSPQRSKKQKVLPVKKKGGKLTKKKKKTS